MDCAGLRYAAEGDDRAMNEFAGSPFRWDPYVLLREDEVTAFWRSHASETERNIAFVLGWGFDPRMCDGVRAVLDAGGKGRRDCLLLDYDEGKQSVSLGHDDRKQANRTELDRVLKGRGTVAVHAVAMLNAEGRRTGARQAQKVVYDANLPAAYTDIVVDVSAMPRALFLSVVLAALRMIDEREQKTPGVAPVNLHVLASEDPGFDAQITEDAPDEHPSPIPGLASDLSQDSKSHLPRLWIPILGERKPHQLRRVFEAFRPSEVCPVLPSPARNPRRADALIHEYRELLFDQYRVEPANFLYADEQNPFEAYRQIRASIRRYNRSLQPLGGCTTCVSAFSSKLLSLGALLACYEAKQQNEPIGILHVEAAGHSIQANAAPNPKLNQLWIAGECYRPFSTP